MKNITLFLLAIGTAFTIQAQVITTVAGDGTAAFSGDGGQATAAGIDYPWGVKFDAAGNMFISIIYDNRIREVNTSGIINTVAGNGVIGFSGNGGAATAAEFTYCHGIAIDHNGNLYEGDGNNNEVRIIDTTTGIINDFAGNNVGGNSGDGGPATAAEIEYPYVMAVDANNNVVVSSYANNIRMVNTSGVISTIMGNAGYGYSGDGGPATAAEMGITFGMIFDNNGNLFFQDEDFATIREINTSGIVSTIAGTPGSPGFSGDGGPATAAEMKPGFGSVAVDAFGDVFIADAGNDCVREISGGVISTIAGIPGLPGFSGDNGPATAAELDSPNDVAIDNAGNLYITDANNNRIRKISGLLTGVKPVQPGSHWAVYPNPSTGLFNITASSKGSSDIESTITVYNTLGENVYNAELKPLPGGSITQNQINLSAMPAGVYIYKITGKDGSLLNQGKMLIEK